MIQRRLGVVVPFKGDAGALQCIGYGAEHQLYRVLLPVGGDADGECALDVQGGKIAAERGVVDLIALFRADAGKVHDLCGGSIGIGHKDLPCTIGVGDVGQPQICSGDAKGSHKAYHHDTKCQHTGRYCLLCGSNCFLQFNGSDTRQLLSLSYLVRPRVLHRHPGRPDCGCFKAEALHSQIRCSLWVKEEASYYRVESALGRPQNCPGTSRICPCRDAGRTAFHFIQIEFKRCNVRCTNGILPECKASVKFASCALLDL